MSTDVCEIERQLRILARISAEIHFVRLASFFLNYHPQIVKIFSEFGLELIDEAVFVAERAGWNNIIGIGYFPGENKTGSVTGITD